MRDVTQWHNKKRGNKCESLVCFQDAKEMADNMLKQTKNNSNGKKTCLLCVTFPSKINFLNDYVYFMINLKSFKFASIGSSIQYYIR